jgi:serine/threonine protein kinase/formylglycine-generating enzyme required for sulfatase activity
MNLEPASACGLCGVALPARALMGLCPRCLVKSGVFSDQGGSAHAGESGDNLKGGQMVGRGRFKLTTELGEGGMGVVWQAVDQELSTESETLLVALKFLASRIRGDPRALGLMREEVLRCRKLRHPRIISIYDWHAPPEEAPFISMEYVEGANLSQLLTLQPGQFLPWTDIAPWIKQLCDALEYAHSVERIVHRDLKPANMMLNQQSELRLADFGLAQPYSDRESGPQSPKVLGGTLLYASPQQLRGEPPQPTDDIYSLGATLYELLTSTPPFYTGDQVRQDVLTTPAEPMAERLARLGYCNEIPARVRITVAACLQKNPADRPQSAREVSHRLGVALLETRQPPRKQSRSAAILADEPETSAKPRGCIFTLALRVALLMLLLAGAGVLYYGSKKTPPQDLASLASPKPRRPVGAPLAGTIPPAHVPPPSPTPTNTTAFLRLKRTGPELIHFCLLSQDRQTTNAAGAFRSSTNLSVEPGASLLLAGVGSLQLAKDRLSRPLQMVGASTTTIELDFRPAEVDIRICKDVDRPVEVTAHDLLGHTNRQLLGDRSATDYQYFASLHPGGWTLRFASPPNYEDYQTNLDLASGGTDTRTIRLEPSIKPWLGYNWTNTLGMVLVCFSNRTFWACATETTRAQYQAFAEAQHLLPQPMVSVTAHGWTNRGDTWQRPGFPQTDNDPVVGVNWMEARDFCAWLTERERALQRLRANQYYDLPSDEEWSHMAGPHAYPWGEEWPPPRNNVNCAGPEAAREPAHAWYPYWPTLDRREHEDFWGRTAPVMVVKPNDHGLYHLGGNVAEWCRDWYSKEMNAAGLRQRYPTLEVDGGGETCKVLRGGSWYSHSQDELRTGTRLRAAPDERHDRCGFRPVLVQGEEDRR